MLDHLPHRYPASLSLLMPKSVQRLFLDLYDGLGLLKLLPRLTERLAQPPNLLVLGQKFLPGLGRTIKRSIFALLAPLGQMRRIKAFPTQKRTDLSRLTAEFGLVQNGIL